MTNLVRHSQGKCNPYSSNNVTSLKQHLVCVRLATYFVALAYVCARPSNCMLTLAWLLSIDDDRIVHYISMDLTALNSHQEPSRIEPSAFSGVGRPRLHYGTCPRSTRTTDICQGKYLCVIGIRRHTATNLTPDPSLF